MSRLLRKFSTRARYWTVTKIMTDHISALDEPLAPPASAAAARSCRWIDLSEGEAKRNAASPARLTSSKPPSPGYGVPWGLLDPPPRFAPAFARLRRGKQRSGYRMEGRPLCRPILKKDPTERVPPLLKR